MSSDPVQAPAVRPRSTNRKRRAEGPAPAFRPASQDRSRRRRDAILDAADALLETSNIEDISLSDLGVRANMSKASVHYHFPTVAAVQLELGRRHDRAVWEILKDFNSQLTKMRVPTWQEWLRIEADQARGYFNSHRPACETLLGPLLHRENRLAALRDNTNLGVAKLRNLSNVFEVPNKEVVEAILPYNGEILDVFWSGSYLTHGSITDQAFEESIRASVGYLRNFLPEVLPMKEPALEPEQAAGA